MRSRSREKREDPNLFSLGEPFEEKSGGNQWTGRVLGGEGD